MSDLDDVNTLAETAAYLKMKEDALQRLARAGKIGSLKQGRHRVFPRRVIEAYIEANTLDATPPNPWGLARDAARRRAPRGTS